MSAVTPRVPRAVVILACAAVPWALCGAVLGIGRQVTSLDNALIIHAIAVPIVFGLASRFYFVRFGYTTPLQTATVFLAFAVTTDAVLVAPILERSYAMFGSVLGTWIPFALIFVSTYLAGSLPRPAPQSMSRRPS